MKKLLTIAGMALALAIAGRAHAQNFSLIHFGGDICTSSAWNSQSVCKIDGTSVPINSAADQTLLTTASATGAWKSLPTCPDTGGNHINYDTTAHAWSCGTSVPSGGGSVTSVNASGGGIFSFTGGPIIASGTLALTVAGTSGGVPYFSSVSALASSAVLTSHHVVLGGGAGAAPYSVSAGTVGQFLQYNGSGVDDSWGDPYTVLSIKPTAKFATTAALPTNAYSNGSSGVGATLTGISLGALSVDGGSPGIGDLILVKNEVAQANNGLYSVTAAGSGAAVYVLTRQVDMNVASEFSGVMIPVGNAGVVNANSLWLSNPSGTVTVGTTAIPFTQLNGATDLIAGTGISISGNTISVSPDTSNASNISSGTLGAARLPANTKVRSFGTTFGDTAGSALTSGSVVYFTIPYTCTISAWNATVDAGTVTFDIWKIATGTAIPTVANTITASALPAISTGTALHSTTLTSWTTSVSVNDIIGIKLQTVATAKYAELDVECDQ